MSNILVPVDGSEHSERAVEYAVNHFPDGDITALHVVELPEGYFSAFMEDLEDLPQVEDEKAEAREILDTIRATAEELGATIDTAYVTGKPSNQILTYAEENDIDEIVIGNRGLSGVGRVMFGSVAEQVVRRSEIPVVVVH
ncbi:Nucleotide-binding protein, UspA family [Halanaeroarchaeum sp. HSR-CO]|uniref:universal stress protein n=1 Tax=Halanaeroarchaeum sp. HSR-CO TaxID=2866382 RepID=UPI00217ED2A1|nr:universal stress protein [Halanaeroarchaeum sp. HSR-CO]UWG47703.1 Nucleotide-binding protein, UspA family [Halanaeroarchaeum sp. HSR-CO]